MDTKLEIDLTCTPEFSLSKNIGQGKQYPSDPLPIEVQLARQQVLALPKTAAALLPSADIPISEFSKMDLPQVTSGFIMYKARKWFSVEEPNVNIEDLRLRPVPNEAFLQALDAAFGQSWFDGARSIIDQQKGDDKERLPLWILTFWKKMLHAIRAHAAWTRSSSWLARQQPQDEDQGPIHASQLLESLGWDKQLTCLRSTVTTSMLQPFLSTAWLSTDQIDMMVEWLNVHGQECYPAVAASKILVVPLIFASALSACSQLVDFKSGNLLYFEKVIKDKEIEKLYFPINLSGNHWIAGCIDFSKAAVSFGV